MVKVIIVRFNWSPVGICGSFPSFIQNSCLWDLFWPVQFSPPCAADNSMGRSTYIGGWLTQPTNKQWELGSEWNALPHMWDVVVWLLLYRFCCIYSVSLLPWPMDGNNPDICRVHRPRMENPSIFAGKLIELSGKSVVVVVLGHILVGGCVGAMAEWVCGNAQALLIHLWMRGSWMER